MRTRILIGVAAGCLLAAPAGAQLMSVAPPPAAPRPPPPAARRRVEIPPAPPPIAKPAPELDTIKFLVGRWKCAGKQLGSPLFGPERPVKATLDVKPDVDGYFQTFTYEEAKGKLHQGLKAHGVWGYEPIGRRFVRAAVDNHGNWSEASANAWEGDQLIWRGQLFGPHGQLPFNYAFGKKTGPGGKTELALDLDLKTPPGARWFTLQLLTCKK